MLFSSSVFLFLFLPVVLLVYYLPLRRWRQGQNVFLLLASLGYAVTEVLGADGTLMVSGNTDLTYLVDTTPTSDNPYIDNYATLDPYKAVGINGATLHVSLEGAPDASRNGDGLKVSNLIGSNASLVVTNTAADAASNHAVVDLVQNIDAGSNSYGGTISGDHVDFIKKGAETLTVEGNFTGNDSMLSSTEGEIVLKPFHAEPGRRRHHAGRPE